MLIRGLLIIISMSLTTMMIAQKTFTLSGYIKDADSGETLTGANIFVKDDPASGTTSNAYGFYSLSLPPGNYTITYSYLGYNEQEVQAELTADQRINIELGAGVDLEEIIVKAEDEGKNVESTKMGTVELPVEDIKKLPALFGEVDILKAIQLLPGVMSAGEGNAGFYVRGGGPDQNLVLLDEAVVYNSGHMLGFFSVFNADAIKNTTLIKGSMPANYGGRLSSVVDVQMKEGNDQEYIVQGGIGLVSSRLTIEGPIQKHKSSFIVSGRRTYVLDLVQPFLEGTDFEGTNYYFYDLNAKLNYRFSDKDRLFLSAYFGRDVLTFKNSERDFFFDLPYGNTTATLRWNHLFTDKLFMNVSAIFNDYDFSFRGGQDEFSVDVFSGVRDWNAKIDFDFFPSFRHNIKFGVNYTYHKLTPNIANATDGETDFSNDLEPDYAHEAAIYVMDDIKISENFGLNVGLRYSYFSQLGPYTSPLTGDIYGKRERVKDYTGFEPRASFRWRLNPQSSIKGGVSYTYQYLHLVSNSTSTFPFDIWVPSTELVRPQRGVQYALGYFRNFANNEYETSIEVYYKDLKNQIDYRENYVNNIADEVENEFVFGTGYSYGAELFLKKSRGRLNGWIGYTWSRTRRIFPEINDGAEYPAVYDRTHDLSIVANYKAGEKWDFGAVVVYGTGNAFTPLKSLYFIEQEVITEYGPRNSSRLPSYHRLDLSATFTPKPNSTKRFGSSWTFSIYNVYNQKNPFFIYYSFEVDSAEGTAEASGSSVTLFPLIPSITWNFKWRSGKKENVK